MKTPEDVGVVIERLNNVLSIYHMLLMDDELRLPAKLASAIVRQYAALMQLRNMLLDAATSPD